MRTERRPISMDEMALFEVSDDGHLYWRGDKVILEKRLRLETYQVWLAVLATFGAVMAGVHPYLVSFGIL